MKECETILKAATDGFPSQVAAEEGSINTCLKLGAFGAGNMTSSPDGTFGWNLTFKCDGVTFDTNNNGGVCIAKQLRKLNLPVEGESSCLHEDNS